MFLKKISTFICPLLLAIGLELFSYNISWIYYLGGLMVLLLLFFLKFLIKEKFFSRDFWGLAILPLLFFLATVGFLLLVSSGALKQFAVVLFALIFFVYLENIYTFFYNALQYQAYSFENLSAFLNLLIFFLSIINLAAFNVFLNLPIWALSLILLVIISLLIFQALWVNKINNKFRYVYLLVFDLILLEFFWCLSFLPSNFYIMGIVMSVIFYLMWGLFKAKLNDQVDKKIFWSYIAISLILLLGVVLTSRWT